MPAVSVVTPTFNRSRLIERAIRSVQAQTFQDWEHIIVDDGSTDDTGEVVQRLAAADSRIKYVRTESNRGSSWARNAGVSNASSELVAFLDSDDEWLPEKLELQLSRMSSSPLDPGVVYAIAEGLIDDANRRQIYVDADLHSGHVFNVLARRSFITFSSVVVRRDLINSIGGFDERMPRGMDRDLLIRLSRVTSFDAVPRILVRQYIGNAQHLRSGNPAKTAVYRELLIEKLRQWPETPRSALSFHHRSISSTYREARDRRRALSHAFRSIQTGPLDLRSWGALVKCFGMQMSSRTSGVISSEHRRFA